jgi:hypothetical protein
MVVEIEKYCQNLESCEVFLLNTVGLSEDLEEAIIVSKEAINLLDNSPDKITWILHEGVLLEL